ncbi:MAG: 5'/3'-nucleotidase SurE [Spirochaetales bacterium]|nr:5'/3'-nucleotidase SurE [Spirochaetales bacterium]
MQIVLTNDDGISHPHLKALAAHLGKEHEVWIMAPSGQQSGCSHGITLWSPIVIKQETEKSFACDGTPVDCVMLALHGFLPVLPENIDMIISGINPGPNLGTDIVYSGTAGGARQGAIMGKPSLAVSINSRENDVDLAFPLEFIAKNLHTFRQLWSPGYFININFPAHISNCPEVKITFPAKRLYHDHLSCFHAPDGNTYCFFTGEWPESIHEKGSDHDAVLKNNISVSFISIHPIHKIEDESARTCVFWKGEEKE